jgi:hypothetical protein
MFFSFKKFVSGLFVSKDLFQDKKVKYSKLDGCLHFLFLFVFVIAIALMTVIGAGIFF